MSKNLFDFGDEKFVNYSLSVEEDTNIEETQSRNDTKKDVENLMEKYKDYSQEELISEFLEKSKKDLADGSLTQESINQIINTLSPYLNKEQSEFLDNLINKLNE